MDSDLTVVYCENGFIAIDSTDKFLKNTYAKEPALTIKLPSAARDIQLSQYLTIVNSDGSLMTVYRKEDLFPTNMKLDDSSPSSSLLSSYFHKRYIVLYILQGS